MSTTVIAIVAIILLLCIFPQVFSAIMWLMLIVLGIVAGILQELSAIFVGIFKDKRKK